MWQIYYTFFIIKESHFIFTKIWSDIWLSGAAMKEQGEPEVSMDIDFGSMKDQV